MYKVSVVMIFDFAMGAEVMGSSFSKPDFVLFPQPMAKNRMSKSDNLFIVH
jgi:hypothetical protein